MVAVVAVVGNHRAVVLAKFASQAGSQCRFAGGAAAGDTDY
jgi:hypothetical protein